MEPEIQEKFELKEENHKVQNPAGILSQSEVIKVQDNDLSISQEVINNKLSKINVQSSEQNLNSGEIHQPLQEPIINDQTQNKEEHHQQKMKIEYSQNDEEKSYIQSIDQIKRILSDKVLNQIKFIQIILRDFSPYAFKNQIKKQKDKKQKDPFDSEVSFTSQGQETNKMQENTPHSIHNNSVFIDKEFFNIQWLQQMWSNELLKKLIMHNPIFHCRIVCILYLLTSNKNLYNLRFPQELLEVKKTLCDDGMRYSFNENIWTLQREQTFKGHERKRSFSNNLQFVIQNLKQDSTFKMIDEFYTKLGFRNKSHPFNKKMTILKQQSYRLRYLKEFSFFTFSTPQQALEYLSLQDSVWFKNIKFYSNQETASSRKLYLSAIHKKYCKDYEWLQSCHNYIQWLFPNHFKSQFNDSSYPLGYVEAEIFKNDPKMRKKLLRSFEIFIDFMGCSIKYLDVHSSSFRKSQKSNKQKSIMIDSNDDKDSNKRLRDCLVSYTHNHLRVMRILACLSVTGLRKYAEALLKFLNRLSNNKDFSCIKYSLQKNWNIYQSSLQNKQKALQMCFIPYQNFSYSQINDGWKGQSEKEEMKRKFLQDDHGKKRVKIQINEK